MVNTTPISSAQSEASPIGYYERLAGYTAPRVNDNRGDLIAKAAYFRAERRGLAPGHEVDDWLAAKDEVDRRLAGEGRAY